VLAAPNRLALIKSLGKELSLDEIAPYLQDVDIILTEGYKRGDKPKIEVSRAEVSSELLCGEEELVAIASDRRFPLRVPQFGLEDASGLADLLEKRFLGESR